MRDVTVSTVRWGKLIDATTYVLDYDVLPRLWGEAPEVAEAMNASGQDARAGVVVLDQVLLTEVLVRERPVKIQTSATTAAASGRRFRRASPSPPSDARSALHTAGLGPAEGAVGLVCFDYRGLGHPSALIERDAQVANSATADPRRRLPAALVAPSGSAHGITTCQCRSPKEKPSDLEGFRQSG